MSVIDTRKRQGPLASGAKRLDVTMPKEGPVSVHLLNKHPGHSKFYDVAIKKEGSGWVVTATYGAIGGNSTPWPVVQNPVPFAEAWNAYAKRVKEQIEKKGYTTKPDGVTMVPWQEALGSEAPPAEVSAEPVVKEHSGWEPLLLKDLDERLDLPRVLGDAGWCAQQKMDGHRISLVMEGERVRAINRTGYYRPIADAVIAEAARLPYGENGNVLDGELIGTTYYAFDLLKIDGIDVTREPYRDRWVALADLLEGSKLVCVPFKDQSQDKRGFVEAMRAARKEGVVFKRLGAPYRPGRTDDYLRLKFVKELDAVVYKVNDRRSVALQLYDPHDKAYQHVGNVTISKGTPGVGEVWTVRYLYCVEGGQLYQPRMMKRRTDKKPSECTMDQIIYKQGEDADSGNP